MAVQPIDLVHAPAVAALGERRLGISAPANSPRRSGAGGRRRLRRRDAGAKPIS